MDIHEFEIALHFAKGTRDPSRIFFSMGEYIDSIALLDSSLLLAFDAKFESQLQLEDIQAGSVRALIRRFLTALDDQALRDGDWKKVVGRFLHKAKYSILRWCAEHEQIDTANLIESKAAEISELAEDTNLHHIPAYQPFRPRALIAAVQGLVNAGKGLQAQDKVVYRAGGEEVEISRTVCFSPEALGEFLPPAPERHRQKSIVRIKKPDFLGNSQWEFRHMGRTIRANILDQEWLTSFQERQFETKPGDALRVILDVSYQLDESGRPSDPRYSVVAVLGIVPGSSDEQQGLFE